MRRGRPAPVAVVTVPPEAWQVALRLAKGDRRRIVVRPSPSAVGGGCLLVLNRPRRRSR